MPVCGRGLLKMEIIGAKTDGGSKTKQGLNRDERLNQRDRVYLTKLVTYQVLV